MRAPDSAEVADAAAGMAGAYVHVPFCARVCPYCDFNVVAGRDMLQPRYVSAIQAEIGAEPRWRPLDAVAFGGGTPSRLPAKALGEILSALDARFGLTPDAEVGLEANPEDWTDSLASMLAAQGFNRLSLGAQSFDERILRRLGRQHHSQRTAEAVASARRAGIASVNIDLIFGTPGEAMSSWIESVDRALDLEPDHLSLYALTVERGTALSRSVAAGEPGPDEDDQADKYEAAVALLDRAGFIRYETSNFARPGHACRYNLLTWGQGEYLGFGPGAHGHRSGARYRNFHRIDVYLDAVEGGIRPEQGRDVAGRWEREQERLILGLRRVAGVEAGCAGRALEDQDWGRRLFAAGVLERSGSRLVVARPLLGDEVARAVLALAPVDC